MPRAAVTSGESDCAVGPVEPGHRLNLDKGRIAILRAGGDSPARLADRLRAALPDLVDITVGRSMLDELLMLAPDVVVIDHLPNSFDIVRVCRDVSDTLSARIIVVSGKGTELDEPLHVAALDAGADDFLPQPTSTALLMAHLRVAFRAAVASLATRGQLVLGDVVIDLDAHALYIAGSSVRCPPRQFMLLAALGVRANRLVSRDSLLAIVWGAEPALVHPRRLRIAVSLLRQTLGSGVTRPRIETVSHVGYRLVVDPVGAAS